MTQTAPAPDVPLARGGVITDGILEQMIGLTGDKARNELSEEGAALLLQNLPGILVELKHRRKVQALIHQATDDKNNIVFPQS